MNIPTVAAVAGSELLPKASHQAVNWLQSERYAQCVLSALLARIS